MKGKNQLQSESRPKTMSSSEALLQNYADDLEDANYGNECLIVRAILSSLRKKGNSCCVDDVIAAVLGIIENETMIGLREEGT